MFRTKFVQKIKTHFMCNNFFFPRIMAFMRCGKIWCSRTGHRWQYDACALHAGYLRLQTQTQICNTHCFSTAIMVARTPLNVTFYVHCLVLFFFRERERRYISKRVVDADQGISLSLIFHITGHFLTVYSRQEAMTALSCVYSMKRIEMLTKGRNVLIHWIFSRRALVCDSC